MSVREACPRPPQGAVKGSLTIRGSVTVAKKQTVEEIHKVRIPSAFFALTLLAEIRILSLSVAIKEVICNSF